MTQLQVFLEDYGLKDGGSLTEALRLAVDEHGGGFVAVIPNGAFRLADGDFSFILGRGITITGEGWLRDAE